MIRRLYRLVGGDEAQDVLEYTLLVAFVAVVSASLFLLSSRDMHELWGITKNNLSAAMSKIG